MRRLEDERRHRVRRHAEQGAHRRRDRPGGRHRSVSAHSQRRARHQVQNRHRLSRRQRCHARHGTRRGEGALRLSTHKRWVEDKSITVLVQLSLNKHPDLPDVPLVMDFAKTEDQQQMFKLIFARQVMGRPYLAPPDVPKDRAETLRKAFMDTMTDHEFLADAEKSQLEITPIDGAEVEKLVKELYQTPKPLADKAAQFIRH